MDDVALMRKRPHASDRLILITVKNQDPHDFVLPCDDSTRSACSRTSRSQSGGLQGKTYRQCGQIPMPVLVFALFYNLRLISEVAAFQSCHLETLDLSQLALGNRPDLSEISPKASRPGVFLMTNTLEVGGSERQFATLVESISRERFEVRPACLRRIGGLVARLGEIPEFPPGGKLLGFQAQRAQLAMIRSMRRNGIAVAHAFDFYTNLMLIPAARMAGVPVIGSHRQLGDLLTSTQFKAQYWAFRFCHRVVCNSQAAAASLRNAGLPEQKLEIIPNGLTEQAFGEYVPAIPRKPGVVRLGM